MKKSLYVTLLLCLAVIFVKAQTPNLYINEFLASNETGWTDASGDYEDWVEIYNAGNSAVDIGGMYITDDLSAPTLWQIPTTDPAMTTIPSNGFLILFFDKDTDEGVLHVDAKLGAGGEAIGLYTSDLAVVDTLTFGPQLQDVAEGRTPDGGTEWAFFTEPTPGDNNDTPTGLGAADIPIANVGGGFYENSVAVSLSSETPDAAIYYRMDGKAPNDNDIEYTGPITISSTAVLRAIAYAPNLNESGIMTHTYIIDEDRENFVVVALTTDPENLFDPEDGLFPNFEMEDLEKNAHIQFFETDGSLAFSQEIEIELQGNGSLTLPQKSLKMKAKASLGNAYFDYKIFPDEAPDKYRSFLMRQSGQDWNRTMFRDALQQTLMADVSDLNGIIEKPDLDLQSYRPGILYINGEYWGVQNIRAQMSWKYLDAHYGLEEEEVDVVEDDDELKTGDLVEWDAFNDYLEDNNFSDPANYVELWEKADVDHFMDYMLHGIIADNNDWPGNNNRHWRERTEDGKWRWLTKDMDFGFGLRPLNGGWDSGDFTTNMLAVCLAENSSEYYNRPPATLFLRRLMENEEAKSDFINRAADLLNTVFEEDRILNRIDDFEDVYSPQMQDHYDVWQSGWNGHSGKVEKLRIFAAGRAPEVRNHFVNQFSEVSGLTDVAIDVNPEMSGSIDFNTLTLNETHFPWAGIYFQGLEIPAFAKPNRGYLFENWSGAASGSNPEVLANINSNSEDLIANFQLGSTATDPIVINEINYNSPDDSDPADWVELFNPNASSVDISGWYFEDESGKFYGFPANTIMVAGAYLLLVEDAATFATVYPDAVNVYGSFGQGYNGFGLSGKGELITLKNAAGVLIDEVDFDDSDPWPEAPDGDGPTLQLMAPALDNALPESWSGFEATPGAINGGGLLVICPAALDFDLAIGATEVAVNWSLPETSTSCLVNSTVSLTQISGPANGSLVAEGTYTIDYLAEDDCDNVRNCSFDITVTATALEATLNCPTDIMIDAVPGATSAAASWATPTGNTNCTLGNSLSIMQTTGLPSGSVFPIGNSTITYTATDDCGTQTTCVFEVVVISSPSTVAINCSNDINAVSPSGIPEIVTWSEPSAITDCAASTFVTVIQTAGLPSGSLFPVGTQTITYEATDACGAVSTCSFDVTVADGTGSISLTCPDDVTVILPVGQTTIPVSWSIPVVSTNCGGGTINPNCGTVIPGFDFIGTLDDHQYYISQNKVTWEVAKANCENSGGYLAVISDQDENEFIAANISDKVYIGLSDANMEGDLEWVNGEPFSYSAVDTDPDVNTPSKDYGYLSPWSEEWKFFSENVTKYYLMELECGGGSSLELVQTGGPSNGGDLQAGSYSVTYEASDDCGDIQFCSFFINVENNPQSLFIDCPADITVTEVPGSGGAPVSWSAATAVSFNCAGAVDVTQMVGLPSGSFFQVGNHVIEYEAADLCGNVASCMFELIVLPNVTSSEYCESEADSPWQNHISNVSFSTINNDSGKDGYGDFTDQVADAVAEATYALSVQPKFSYTQYDIYVKVWIDYNRDFDFTDQGELIYAVIRPAGTSGSVVDPLTASIEIPEGVTPGLTRLRVSMKRNAYSDSCEAFEFGEVEDYSLNLLGSGPSDFGFGRDDSGEVAAAKTFTVYPNPVRDLLTIDLGEIGKSAQVLEMYNALGERVFVQNFVDGKVDLISVDVSEYGRGLYFVSMVDLDGGRVTEQVLVQ